MNIWDIAKNVGAGIIRNVVPGGSAIIDTVNAFLPDESKLGGDATGSDIASAVQALPPEKRAELMEKQFEVDITQIKESNSTVRMMLESDASNPHSTRPYIAKGAFHMVAFTVSVVISTWAYGVIIENDKLVKTVMDGWPFVVGVITPLVVVLQAYFGVLKQEHKQRMNAAGGKATQSGIAGILSAVLKR